MTLAGTIAPAWNAWADTAVGYVERVTAGSSSTCLISRGQGHNVPCLILTEVSKHDGITLGDGGKLTLRLYNGKVKVFGSPGGTVESDVDSEEPGYTSKLLQMVHSMIGPEQNSSVVVAAVRGDDSRSVAAPLLDADVATLVEGTRSLSLGWSGGVAPYDFRVSDATDEPVLDLPDLPTTEFPPQPIDLTPGDYTLTITDAKGSEIERDVEVVTAAEVPKAPEDPGLARLPAEYHTLAQAGWLSQQEDGRWRLEAYLQLRALPQDFAPARLLAEALARGED